MSKKVNSDAIGATIEQITEYFPDGKEFELGWPILKMADFKRVGLKSRDVRRKLNSAINKKHRNFKKQLRKSDFGAIHMSDLYKKEFHLSIRISLEFFRQVR